MTENDRAACVNRANDQDDDAEDDANDAHGGNIASHFQALLVWDNLSPLDIALE